MKLEKLIYIPEYIRDLVDLWEPVGSRECCVPAPTNTDLDILILSEQSKRFDLLEEELCVNKWKCDGSYSISEFVSYKKQYEGELVNLIITDNPDFYSKFLAAHLSCKEKNLLEKKDRIQEFEKWLPKKEQPNWVNPVWYKPTSSVKKEIYKSIYGGGKNWATIGLFDEPVAYKAIYDSVSVTGGTVAD